MLFIIGCNMSIYAQTSGWNVQENDFEYTMTYVAFLSVDAQQLGSTNDKVAAFVNGNCRGTTNLIYDAVNKRYVAYLIVFSNANGEKINFKIYDSNQDIVVDAVQEEVFQLNKHQGNLLQAFCISDKSLNNQAELLSVDLVEVNVDYSELNENKFVYYISKDVDLSNVITQFEFSPQAVLFVDGVKYDSKTVLKLDLTKLIEINIKSQDETVYKEWELDVKRIPVITLLGDTTIVLERGNEYIDEGAVAFDSDEDDISNEIEVSNAVNTEKEGDYKVIYKVKDKKGYEAVSVVRHVTITKNTNAVIYYKKDALCYKKGSIKVVYSINEKEVVLLLNGKTHSKKTISNGEVIFEDLSVGDYSVLVEGNTKHIEINEKK